ncbi:MAG: homoserine kinase [Mariprofundaceae bacterium]
MSVYTELTHDDIACILTDYKLGLLKSFEGIAAGIENSNFFIDTEQGRYVLTIFERMDADELPYFMRLMRHLAALGMSCPDVMARQDGSLLFECESEASVKQGCIVSCLPGKTLDELNIKQLKSAGRMLAQLHLAGQGFTEERENPTGMDWLEEKVKMISQGMAEAYGDRALELLQSELHFQQEESFDGLVKGVIHGDLFVDNILFDADEVSGVIDFYYAHTSAWIVDVAISLNAQAVLLGEDDEVRIQSFLEGYESLRVLGEDEMNALPTALRLSALRFWVSRLYDALFPRDGAMTQVKDPEEYRGKLLLHRSE